MKRSDKIMLIGISCLVSAIMFWKFGYLILGVVVFVLSLGLLFEGVIQNALDP